MAAAPSRFRSVSEDDLDNLLAFFWTTSRFILKQLDLIFDLDFYRAIVDSGFALNTYHAIEISSS